MLESYLGDLIDAGSVRPQSAVREKYAWMMEHSLPDAFAQVRHCAAVHPTEQLAEVENAWPWKLSGPKNAPGVIPPWPATAARCTPFKDTREQTSMETLQSGRSTHLFPAAAL